MKRTLITAGLLIAALIVAYAFPKAKYESPDILGTLKIPYVLPDWRSEDMSEKFQISQKDDRYNFIDDIFARFYGNRQGQGLMLIVLDAGNFHNPRVCFSASGFETRQLPDTVIPAAGRQVRAKTVSFTKGDEKYLILYWITINGKQVDWAAQKWSEFWHTLLGKKKVGLMVRMDIPLTGDDQMAHLKFAQQFIVDLAQDLGESEKEYLFGK